MVIFRIVGIIINKFIFSVYETQIRYFKNYRKAKREFSRHLKNHLSGNDPLKNWDQYRKNFVYPNRYNKDFLPEIILNRFKNDVLQNYINKYPFLKRYCEIASEYQDFLKDNYYETFTIGNNSKTNRVLVELFNVKREDLYFPNILIVLSVHSALHSAVMVLHILKNYPQFRKNILLLYDVTQIIHAGDREYVLYMADTLKLPLVVLSLKQNSSFSLMVNGLPKVQKFGRYCTRIWKIEPTLYFYKRFFYPIQHKIRYTWKKDTILRFLAKHKIVVPKKIVNGSKPKLQEWVLKKVNLRPQITEKTTKYKPITVLDQKIDNVIQLIGIASYQSKRREKMDPSLKLTKYSDSDVKFKIYEMYPIFHLSFDDLVEIIDDSPLTINPYDLEYKDLNEAYREAKKEVRLGCIMCMFKQGDYYKFLFDNYPDRYYYCRMIKTIASTKNLIKENREYDKYDENDTPKSHPEWKHIF